MQWHREQVLALAPDSASIKAAQKLTAVTKWPLLGGNADLALWGECQGSGKTPYQTAIDLREVAFKCSCPSRKFPCKHALALFLLFVEQHEAFANNPTPPDWAQSWLDKRAERQADTTANATTAPTTSQTPALSPEKTKTQAKAQAKRAADRAQKVADGVVELSTWLEDLVRKGFVEAQGQPYRYWQTTAARLIDAQAPGLAGQVELLGSIVNSGEGWAERMTVAVGKLFLLLEAYQRLEALPIPLQHDVRTLVGWHQTKEELLTGEPVHDHWHVLSHALTQEETLVRQQVWLQSLSTGQYALILNFAHPSNRQSLDLFWRAGAVVTAKLYYYRSAAPLRALATDVIVANTKDHLAQASSTTALHNGDPLDNFTSHAYPTLALGVQQRQQLLAQQPWLTQIPMSFAALTVAFDGQQKNRTPYFRDRDGYLLPMSRADTTLWQMLSISGGHPVDLFGEWLEDGFLPLGLVHAGDYWPL